GETSAYAIRPWASTDDPRGPIRLLQAVEATDQDGADVREETLQQLLTLPGHDPERDRFVAVSPRDPTTLLGWGFVWHMYGERMATLTGAVLPAWRRGGIGGALLERALIRAVALGAQAAGMYVYAGNEVGAHFATQHGFRPVSTNTLLRAAGDAAWQRSG